MRNADYQEKGSLTEIRKEVGFAELWLALEFAVLKGVRSRHSRPNLKVREHQQGEIALHRVYDLKKPGWLMRQCEGGGKWKTHKGSEALFQAR